MTTLETRALSQAKECCDNARNATYKHNWPKDLQAFIDDPKNGFLKVKLEESTRIILQHISQTEAWIDAVLSKD